MTKKGFKHVESGQVLSCLLKGLSMYVVNKREFREKGTFIFRMKVLSFCERDFCRLLRWRKDCVFKKFTDTHQE